LLLGLNSHFSVGIMHANWRKARRNVLKRIRNEDLTN